VGIGAGEGGEGGAAAAAAECGKGGVHTALCAALLPVGNANSASAT